MKKKLLTLGIISIVAISLFACGKKEDTTKKTTTPKVTTEEKSTTESTHKGEGYNELTGEYSKEFVRKRPVAVMINNIKAALPSSSTKQADIIYECMVEGGITRLLAIYSDVESLEKIGSVRSARHYYINLANEYDAIYVHYGASNVADEILAKGVINNIDGMTYGPGFYRDNSRQAPHNAYTAGDRVLKGMEDKGYKAEYSDSHEEVLSFNEKDKDLKGGEAANTIHVNFSSYSKPYFIYNSETKLYDRYEYNAPQIDNQEEDGKNILTFKNVIVQISSYECINPENDLQDLKQVGEGKGYYCTNGKAIPITWKKSSTKAPTKFFNEDGSELLLNPGKTWISIIDDSKNAGVSFE